MPNGGRVRVWIGSMEGGTKGQVCGGQIGSRSSVLLHRARTSPLTHRQTQPARLGAETEIVPTATIAANIERPRLAISPLSGIFFLCGLSTESRVCSIVAKIIATHHAALLLVVCRTIASWRIHADFRRAVGRGDDDLCEFVTLPVHVENRFWMARFWLG